MLVATLNPIRVADYKELFPNVSFTSSGPSKQWLEENNATTVSVWVPYDHETQTIESCNPYLEEGIVYTVRARELTEEELAARDNQKRQQNKSLAESLLAATDWTEIPSVYAEDSVPRLTNYNEFVSYRMSLRLIAVNKPVVVEEWPVKPEENWI